MKDEKLQGNEKIEAAIEGLKKEPTREMLAHTLTVLRRRMKEGAELIVAVDPAAEGFLAAHEDACIARGRTIDAWAGALRLVLEAVRGA